MTCYNRFVFRKWVGVANQYTAVVFVLNNINQLVSVDLTFNRAKESSHIRIVNKRLVLLRGFW